MGYLVCDSNSSRLEDKRQNGLLFCMGEGGADGELTLTK